MEYELLGLLVDAVTEKYFYKSKNIYEFGCGIGHNLLRIRRLCVDSVLHGLDWSKASQKILKQISEQTLDDKLFGYNFDYFNPGYEMSIAPDSAVIAIASLEQTGTDDVKFINYLTSSKPGLVIHIEPIGELLDPADLVDNLSIKYFKKRNYLKGLLNYLRILATEE
jgi:hypothetical protein